MHFTTNEISFLILIFIYHLRFAFAIDTGLPVADFTGYPDTRCGQPLAKRIFSVNFDRLLLQCASLCRYAAPSTCIGFNVPETMDQCELVGSECQEMETTQWQFYSKPRDKPSTTPKPLYIFVNGRKLPVVTITPPTTTQATSTASPATTTTTTQATSTIPSTTTTVATTMPLSTSLSTTETVYETSTTASRRVFPKSATTTTGSPPRNLMASGEESESPEAKSTSSPSKSVTETTTRQISTTTEISVSSTTLESVMTSMENAQASESNNKNNETEQIANSLDVKLVEDFRKDSSTASRLVTTIIMPISLWSLVNFIL